MRCPGKYQPDVIAIIQMITTMIGTTVATKAATVQPMDHPCICLAVSSSPLAALEFACIKKYVKGLYIENVMGREGTYK